MKVDIIVDGRKVGTATVNIEVPAGLAERYGVTAEAVLKALHDRAHSPSWYCMGAVQLLPQA